jgi:hypothetical protein
MAAFFGSIVGNIVNFIMALSHAFNILFRNFILLAFILAFLYGLFRLGQNGWQYLRGRRPQDEPGSTPEDQTKNGGK